jgi:beta-galactosidase/beta-glucuronidase
MAENGKGNEVTVNTDWTGDIVDRSYFDDIRYKAYRQPGNIKIPFWLKPVKYYKGPAWYQKDVEIPESWSGKRIILSLERCHWESTVYINDSKAGTQNSLSTPHEYDLTGMLVPGKNRISIRIDNRVIIPIGVNSHSITDHTQTNWNGITGEINLTANEKVFIDEIKVFPDLQTKTQRSSGEKSPTSILTQAEIRAQSFNSPKSQKLPGKYNNCHKIGRAANYSDLK